MTDRAELLPSVAFAEWFRPMSFMSKYARIQGEMQAAFEAGWQACALKFRQGVSADEPPEQPAESPGARAASSDTRTPSAEPHRMASEFDALAEKADAWDGGQLCYATPATVRLAAWASKNRALIYAALRHSPPGEYARAPKENKNG